MVKTCLVLSVMVNTSLKNLCAVIAIPLNTINIRNNERVYMLPQVSSTGSMTRKYL
jgi:hypothetical protein